MDFFVKKSLTTLLSVIIIILNKFLGGKYMFSNIGNKIRVLAKVICIIGMVLAGIVGLIIGLSAAGLVLIVGAIIAVAVTIKNNQPVETERTKRTTESEETDPTTEPVSELAERTIITISIIWTK